MKQNVHGFRRADNLITHSPFYGFYWSRGKMVRDATVGAASEFSVAQPVFQASLKTRRELCHIFWNLKLGIRFTAPNF